MEAKNKVKLQQPSRSYIPPSSLFSSNPRLQPKNQNSNTSNIGVTYEYSQCSICFNPYCTLPYSRIFQKTHSHANVQACSKWVIAVKKLGQCLGLEDYLGNRIDKHKDKSKRKKRKDAQVEEVEKQIKEIKLDLGRRPISQNIEEWKIIGQVDWNQYLQDFKGVFLGKIEGQFNQAIEGLRTRIYNVKGQQVTAELVQLYQNIQGRAKNQVQLRKQLEYIMQSYINPIADKTISIKCPNIQEIQMPAFSSLTSLLQTKLFTQSEQEVKMEVVKQTDHEQFRQYMLGDNLASFNKYQQIASICGKKPDTFVLRPRVISLKCPFCNYSQKEKISVERMDQQLKMIKKQLASQLLNHCFSCHYSFIYEKYQSRKGNGQPLRKGCNNSNTRSHMSNMNSSEIKQITFHDFMQEIESKRYNKLYIIDRQTGLTSKQKYQPNSCYIEVISKLNYRMAKGKYILTSDRKCTQFLINYMVIYICNVKEYLDIKDVKIQSNSKDINRVTGIIDMLTSINSRHPDQENKRQMGSKMEDNDQHKNRKEKKEHNDRHVYDQQQAEQGEYEDGSRSGNENGQAQYGQHRLAGDDEQQEGQLNQMNEANQQDKDNEQFNHLQQDFSFNYEHMRMRDPNEQQPPNTQKNGGQQNNTNK